jgi:hypothetical protein
LLLETGDNGTFKLRRLEASPSTQIAAQSFQQQYPKRPHTSPRFSAATVALVQAMGLYDKQAQARIPRNSISYALATMVMNHDPL